MSLAIDMAFAWFDKSEDELDQSGFTRSIRTNQTNHIISAKLKTDIFEKVIIAINNIADIFKA